MNSRYELFYINILHLSVSAFLMQGIFSVQDLYRSCSCLDPRVPMNDMKALNLLGDIVMDLLTMMQSNSLSMDARYFASTMFMLILLRFSSVDSTAIVLNAIVQENSGILAVDLQRNHSGHVS